MASNRATTIKDTIVVKTEEMAHNKANNGAEGSNKSMELTPQFGIKTLLLLLLTIANHTSDGVDFQFTSCRQCVFTYKDRWTQEGQLLV